MKRYFRLAVVVATLAWLVIGSQPSNAQVYSLYEDLTIVQASYRPLEEGAYTELNSGDFALPPNFTPTNRDDGYHKFPVQLPFAFEYNDEVYDRIWVNVNGFICFTTQGTLPPNVAPNVNDALFIKSNSYPNNVIAPYWGDHYYRSTGDVFNKYIRSSIRVGWEVYDPPYRVFIVEWVDLNINDKSVKSSVATFQLRLYESKDPYSAQGDIEFAYSRTGSPDLDPTVGDLVIIRGATVGIKGESSGITGIDADYMNGLMYDQLIDSVRTSRMKTAQWPPSAGATDQRIRFTAIVTKKIEEWWGDGDVNISKAIGNKHYDLRFYQNRWVTVEDARLIMHSMATGKLLDSVRRREAYHGDVNHNGRFYYDITGEKKFIPWRSKNYWEDLPLEVGSIKMLYFQVTEYDASMILHYIAARVPSLPWLLDTVVKKGKYGVDDIYADNIKLGDIRSSGNNTYLVPVYLNGYLNGPLGFKFDVNADIVNATSASGVSVMNGSNVLVGVGSGEYDLNTPVCYLTVKTDDRELVLNNIRFNDVELGSMRATLAKTNFDDAMNALIQNSPNPFTSNTTIELNIQQKGFYNLAIFDSFGNKIRTVVNNELSVQPYNFNWDGTDEFGNPVASGIYVYKLTGDNLTVSKKMILNR
jgi:hypothetical protein